MNLLAQTPIGNLRGIGPLGEFETDYSSGCAGPFTCALYRFSTIISIVIGVLTIAAGLWFIFQIFGGALQWLASGGEKQALQNAQRRLTNAIIGLLIVILSYTFIYVIGVIFGLDILNLYDLITSIAPQ